MLKINLLPPYVYEKRKIRRAAFLFGLLLIGVLAGMSAWTMMLRAHERQLTAQVADMEQKANEVRQLEAQAQAEEGRIPVIQSKVGFIESVMAYNLEFPKLYEELAKYTYSRILYRSIDPSGGQLKIQAHARSVGDCGRYLLNMYRASHIFSSVTIDAVPGWPREGAGGPGQERGFDFNVTCTLAKPISPPTYAPGAGAPPPSGVSAPGGGAAPGMPAPPGGETAPGMPAPAM